MVINRIKFVLLYDYSTIWRLAFVLKERNKMDQNNDLLDYFFEDPILWQFSPSKLRTLLYSLKYAGIIPAAYILAGLILALVGVVPWIVFSILFGGVTVITLFISILAVVLQKRIKYTITETKIIIDYPKMSCISDFTNIVKIKKSHSLFNRNVGTIKFRVKEGFSVNYQFANIDNVESVYELLISLWGKHK